MFHPLPAETVFEAKRRSRRATVILFAVLVFLYILFADLMALAVVLFINSEAHKVARGSLLLGLGPALFWTGAAAALAAILHFISARSRSLDSILDQIAALPPDPKDEVHARFLNLVGEAEAATGIHGIRPVVLATPGCNAFSLQDGHGHSAIGVTEGILSKLSRNELSAVVAHEAAHLAHEDSRLVTTACFLFGVFGKINSILGQLMSRGSSRKGPGAVVIALWAISGVGYFITRWISMSISREREYFADSDGVHMCKDPLAMAEGLYKISNRYKGNYPEALSAMFILNPAQSGLHEDEGFLPNLFSTHPPVGARIDKLVAWAKSDLGTMISKAEKEGREGASSGVAGLAPGEKASYMLSQDGSWAGPYTPLQLLSLGNLAPGSWVCPTGTQEVSQASQVAELLPLFEDKVKEARSKNLCPRCKTTLLSARYEGAEVEQCGFCEGHLLPAGTLERIVIREDETFTKEQVKKAKAWRDSPKSNFGSRDPSFPEIQCPSCRTRMAKAIHSALSQVMIDRCTNYACGAVWCDGGELETIQILMEDARKMTQG